MMKAMLVKNVKSEDDLYANWLVVKRIAENYALDDCEGCSYQPVLSIKTCGQ